VHSQPLAVRGHRRNGSHAISSALRYSPAVERLLKNLGGGGLPGGAAAHDTEVFAADVAAALDRSGVALQESARVQLLQRSVA
jgi:hypothetical protein